MSDIEVPISGESIKLGQFIKLASLVSTGGEAKAAIAEELSPSMARWILAAVRVCALAIGSASATFVRS